MAERPRSISWRVVPGDVDESRLYQLIAARNDADTSNDATSMPPTGAVSADAQALIASWIAQGALDN